MMGRPGVFFYPETIDEERNRLIECLSDFFIKDIVNHILYVGDDSKGYSRINYNRRAM